jgi:hypothetical protein
VNCGMALRSAISLLVEWIFRAISCISFFLSLPVFLKIFFQRSSSLEYGVTPIQSVTMFYNLLELGKKTMVWPNSEELFMGGSKIQGYETLRLASQSMGISTPLYVMARDKIHDVEFLKMFAEGKFSGVLKRDYSMKCEHVLTPGDTDLLAKMKKAVEEEEETWKKVEQFFGRPKWFIQPFVAQLKHVGEVRAFIVEGRVLYHITTTPEASLGNWDMTDHEPLRPLHTHL